MRDLAGHRRALVRGLQAAPGALLGLRPDRPGPGRHPGRATVRHLHPFRRRFWTSCPACGETGRIHAGRCARCAVDRRLRELLGDEAGQIRPHLRALYQALATAERPGTVVSGIARIAGVDRTFLYRHRDLLEKIHVLEASPPAAGETPGHAVTRTSLQADLLAAHERAAHLNARVRQLEKRLPQALGEQTWRQSGLGAPADTDTLNNKIAQLEHQAAGLRLQLSERDDELAAARAANRELMAQLNATARRN